MPDIIKVQVRAETKDAEEKLKRAQALADALGAKQTTIKIDAKSIDGAGQKIRILQSDMAKFKMDSNVFNAFIEGAVGMDAALAAVEPDAKKAGKALKDVGAEGKKTSSVFSTLTKRFTAGNLAASLITAGVNKLKQALREAVTEMKEMDKELTTIKMVTGASDSDISALRQQAFAGARDTGRTTSDYLSAAERFARAGYRENIQDLTKLSLVTQNVGGVTEDVASKFILAADAAWQMGGSTERLWSMLDGVTAIADQNATDIGKIAEAYTVAGSAFANAGESERTFAALIGTTTAATQRSGSEMARGLQTILFRVRQVKGELDDGEMIEAEDISNAAKALDSVGISVLNDAKELKSFSQIMGELSEKWETLNTKQKAYLQNALAGNRRGNVLFSLMDNWNVFEKQLQQFDEASGTALEKNATFTDSWAAATNNLKTSWTNLIGVMTKDGGVLKESVTWLGKALNYVAKDARKRNDAFEANKLQAYKDFRAGDQALFHALYTPEEIAQFEKQIAQTEEAQNVLANATIEVIKVCEDEAKAVDALSEAFSRANKNIKDAAESMKDEKDSSIKSAADIYKAMQEAAEKGYYGSEAYKAGAKLFFGTSDKSAVSEVAQDALDAYFDAISKGDYSNAAASLWGSFADESGEIVDSASGAVIASMRDVGDSYEWAFNKGNKSISEFLTSMESATGVGADFWASMIRSLGMYSDEMDKWMQENIEEPEPELTIKADTDQAQSAIDNINKMLDGIKDKTVRVNIIQSISGSSVSSATQTVHQAATEQAIKEGGANSYMWSGYASSKGLQQRAGGKRDNYSGIALVNDEFPADGSKPELIISKSQGRAYIANGGKPALVNLRSDDIVLTAKETKSAIGVPTFEVGKKYKDAFDRGEVSAQVKEDSLRANENAITAKTPKSPGSGQAGNGGGGSEAAADASASWDQLKKLIDYMIDQEKDVLDDKLAILDDQLKELEAARKSQNRMDELAQKLVAVDEAQLDLQKAQSERTVRYYNESTHQWEWMADQGTLAKAEEAYATALKNLNDFLIDLDFEKQKEAIQAQKDALQEAFDAYKEGWDLIVESIEAPTGDLVELFADLKANGTDAMKAQSQNIETLLGALAEGFFTGIEDTTLASQTGIADTLNTINTMSENSLAIAMKAIENIRSRADTLSISASETAKTTLLSISTDANSALAGMSKDAQGSVTKFSAVSSKTLESVIGKAEGTLNTMASTSSASVVSLTTNVGESTNSALSGITSGANDFLKSATGSAADVSKSAIDSISKVAQKANSFLDSVKNVNKQQTEEKKAEAAKVKSGSGSKSGTKDKKETKPKKEKEPVLKTTTGDSIIKKAATGLVEASTKQDLAKKAITNTVANMVKKVTSTVNNNGGNTYVNGLKIGEDQMKQPLSNVLNTLKLHTNMTK